MILSTFSFFQNGTVCPGKPLVSLSNFFILSERKPRKREKKTFPQAKEALVNRPEKVDQEPGSFGFLVNLRAYRTESFGFLPEIQGNQEKRVDQGKPKVFPTFPFRGKN